MIHRPGDKYYNEEDLEDLDEIDNILEELNAPIHKHKKLDLDIDDLFEQFSSEDNRRLNEILEERRKMKSEDKKDYEIGCIVGRFQVDKLHEGHCNFINKVCDKHKKVIIFLGVSPLLTTRNNPLDFASRERMLKEGIAADVTIIPIQDVPDDNDWSRNLDTKIREVYHVGDVMLYGSRDSFIKYYHGKFPTTEIDEEVFISGTGIREEIKRTVGNTKEFRGGVIYGAYNQYPKVCPTVDVAIVKYSDKPFVGPEFLLLGRKPHENKFRFIGGFADPKDNSFEATAKREVTEETGVEVEIVDYIGSYKIDDWRYRSEVDKIMTTFFKAKYIFGKPTPADDICELRWLKITDFAREDFIKNNLVPEHYKLMVEFLKNVNYEKKDKFTNED